MFLVATGRTVHAPGVQTEPVARRRLGAAAILLFAWMSTSDSGCARSAAGPIDGGLSMNPPLSGPHLPGAEPFSDEVFAALRDAVTAMGPAYVARTRHKGPEGSPLYTNRLILETSPYLLQHAHNPVNWHPWGEEAFAVAQKTGRPILLSVGYSTCHWCHVMEEESFEDEEIAAYINAHYVPIKVDREERPDVDAVYMTAVQLMNQGGGGWPMTVVMTPERQPFFGGTYFPPRDGARGSRVGFLTILARIIETYDREPGRVRESAEQLSAFMSQRARPEPPQGLPRHESLSEAARALVGRFDPRFGGIGTAPKFPRPSVYELLLRYHRRTRDEAALTVVTFTLERMIEGGIHDQIGGGFHRYSTDDQWLVPHFEKMLYDNAQLAQLMTEAYQATGDARFKDTVIETLEYVLREMTSPDGGFFSATDADSEGEEGTFFVWTPDQIRAELPESRTRIALAAYGVTPGGNFEGKNILQRMRPLEAIARELQMDEDVVEAELTLASKTLYEARAKRIPPLRDDKILTEWNAQMISAFARAALAFGETRFLEPATRAADFMLDHMRAPDGRLLRAHRAGRSRHAGVLEDHAYAIAAFLDLFEATGSIRWLDEALALEGLVERHFADAQHGGFFSTADDAEALLVREKPVYDGAQPSGNAVCVLNLLRLATLTREPRFRALAEGTLKVFGASLERGALECPKLAQGLDFYLDAPKEIVVVTNASDDGRALLEVIGQTFVPNRALVRVEEGAALDALRAKTPLVADKRAIGGKATAYVCRDQACDAPTSSPATLRAQLESVEPFPLTRKLALPR